MRWKTGFFRLWVVATIVWIVGCAFNGYDSYTRMHSSWLTLATVPMSCKDAKGVLGTDFGFSSVGPGLWDKDTPAPPVGFVVETCWQPLTTYRRLNPTIVKGRSDLEIVEAWYRQHAPDEYLYRGPDALEMAGVYGALAVVVPLLVLGIGWVVGWIISGFRRTAA